MTGDQIIRESLGDIILNYNICYKSRWFQYGYVHCWLGHYDQLPQWRAIGATKKEVKRALEDFWRINEK